MKFLYISRELPRQPVPVLCHFHCDFFPLYLAGICCVQQLETCLSSFCCVISVAPHLLFEGSDQMPQTDLLSCLNLSYGMNTPSSLSFSLYIISSSTLTVGSFLLDSPVCESSCTVAPKLNRVIQIQLRVQAQKRLITSFDPGDLF